MKMSEDTRKKLNRLNDKYLGAKFEPDIWSRIFHDENMLSGSTIRRYIEFEDCVEKYKLEPDEVLDYLNTYYEDNWTSANVPEFIYENGEYYGVIRMKRWNGFKESAV